MDDFRYAILYLGANILVTIRNATSGSHAMHFIFGSQSIQRGTYFINIATLCME